MVELFDLDRAAVSDSRDELSTQTTVRHLPCLLPVWSPGNEFSVLMRRRETMRMQYRDCGFNGYYIAVSACAAHTDTPVNAKPLYGTKLFLAGL